MSAPAGSILVRLPSWLGDLVAVEPAVRALATARGAPGGEGLSLAAPEHLLPALDGWLPAARRIGHRGRGGERSADWAGHDLALLFTGSFRSAWTALRAGIPRRVGWARDGRGPLLTDSIAPALERGGVPLGLGRRGRSPRYLPRPVTATAIELVALLGVSTPDVRPRLAPSAAAVAQVTERLARSGITDRPVVANVGGRPGSAKAWPADRWVEALSQLDAGAGLVLVAGPGEEEAARAVVSGLAERGRPAVLAWDDRMTDLPELLALAARARVFLTTDAGPRHLARAAGAPTVVLFGPTDPRHTAGPGPLAAHLREPVDCGPCHRERCPLAGARRLGCQTALEPRSVAAAVRDLERAAAVDGRR